MEHDPATIEQVSKEELAVLLRLLSTKLPPVVEALNAGDNGWKQTMAIACWLLAGTLNRHPEYTGNCFALLSAFAAYYPHVEAEFAKVNTGLASQLLTSDTAFFLIPSVVENITKGAQ